MAHITSLASDGNRLPLKQPKFGRVPWDIWVAQNQVINREFIDVFGYALPTTVLARNKYERLEKFLDAFAWIVIGVGSPILLDMLLNKRLTRGLLKEFPKVFLSRPEMQKLFPKGPHIPRPNGIPFELLDKAGFNTRFTPGNQAVKTLNEYGLKELPKALADKILKYKAWFLWIDLAAMASKGQIYYWGKNYITEKWSGKKGYAGEFNYASDNYLQHKSSTHERTKKLKQILSVVVGYSWASAFPLIMYGLLRSKVKPGTKGLVGSLKKIIPAFNYYNVVYMSRWVMLWHNIMNWNILGMVAARDSHEMREVAVKTGVADFFYFVGDDIFRAGMAKVMEWKYKNQLKGLRLVRKGPGGIPLGISLHEFEDMAKRLTPEQRKTVMPFAQKLVRVNFWSSLVAAALGLGVSMTLLNNWYTKQKVLREQAELLAKQPQYRKMAMSSY